MAKGKKTGGKDFEVGNNYGKGRPRLSMDIKNIRNSLYTEVYKAASLLTMTDSEVQESVKSESSTQISKILYAAIMDNDFKVINTFIERLLGKPSQEIKVDAGIRVDKLTEEQKLMMAKEFIEVNKDA